MTMRREPGSAERQFGSRREEAPEAETRAATAVIDITEKIDDPVRMYLTQMGEIPLLTREEEISLARKIELTRKQFRKEVLSSGFGLACAIEILEDVVRGELAFDRTLKVNQQDPEIGQGRSLGPSAGQHRDAAADVRRGARATSRSWPPTASGRAAGAIGAEEAGSSRASASA